MFLVELVEAMVVSIIGRLERGNDDFCQFLFTYDGLIRHLRLSIRILAGHATSISGGFCSHGVVGLSFYLSLTQI